MPITAPGTPIPTATEEIPETLESALPAPQINIQRRLQREDAWCYAACAVMAIRYVAREIVRQCEIASFVKADECCDSNAPNSCTNSGCSKNQIRSIFTNWNVRSTKVNGQITFTRVRTEINADRPIEVVIDWDGAQQSSHAVLITGFIAPDKMVYVIDPLTSSDNNTGWTTYDSLTLGFGYGNWDMTWRRLRIDD